MISEAVQTPPSRRSASRSVTDVTQHLSRAARHPRPRPEKTRAWVDPPPPPSTSGHGAEGIYVCVLHRSHLLEKAGIVTAGNGLARLVRLCHMTSVTTKDVLRKRSNKIRKGGILWRAAIRPPPCLRRWLTGHSACAQDALSGFRLWQPWHLLGSAPNLGNQDRFL